MGKFILFYSVLYNTGTATRYSVAIVDISFDFLQISNERERFARRASGIVATVTTSVTFTP